ncbi:MAG: carbohydrate ABC transporter permease [Anaerolineae bacterium]|nr:MAG: carbohydrate ABC transporter permease [Anaerolineae bacterium]
MTEQSARLQSRPVFFRSKRFQERFIVVASVVIIILGALVILFPISWMVSTSLKTRMETLAMPPIWIPKELQWINYKESLTFNPFGLYFVNTAFKYVLWVVLGETLSCAFIAFGFARLRSPLRNALFLLLLSTMMLPAEVTLIPTYILFSKLGWTNSFKPLVVPAFFGSAYLIFLLRQFYLGIPKEYDEAAIIDGASYFGIWWRIILPMSRPALGAVAIMSFMWHWRNYQGPLIYLSDNNKFTLSLGLSMFRTPFGGTPWHWLMAASLIVILPCVIMFFVFQRYFIQGVVISGVKG